MSEQGEDVSVPPMAGAPAVKKIAITAYINVTSGCQASTVELVQRLAEEYADLVDLELIDFGSPDGQKRWRNDGMDCMGLLFDDGSGPSPALSFPNAAGEKQTTVFFMPAGFGWTHEDLEQAFVALRDGTLKILSEDEAQRELAPRPVEASCEVVETAGGAEVLIDLEKVFVVQVDADGKMPLERAETAKEAIDAWLSEPVHPSQLQVAATDDGATVLAKDKVVITVTKADADAAKMKNPAQLASKWVNSMKAIIIQVVRDSETE